MTTPVNYGRNIAYRTLRETLLELFGRPGVSEIGFRDAWLGRLQADPRLYRDGWYVPPPHGLAVLFGSEASPDRISFSSLRDDASWPSERTIEWSNGLMYAYCSPVDTDTGLMGDFAVTLYFGGNERLREHFRRCHAATWEVLDAADAKLTASELFAESQRIFAAHGLENAVISSTDTTPLDLGHSLASLGSAARVEGPSASLSETDVETLSCGRKFISADHDWALGSFPQFTVEPQLRSIEDLSLPQVSFHYVVSRDGSVLAECDELFEMYELSR